MKLCVDDAGATGGYPGPKRHRAGSDRLVARDDGTDDPSAPGPQHYPVISPKAQSVSGAFSALACAALDAIAGERLHRKRAAV